MRSKFTAQLECSAAGHGVTEVRRERLWGGSQPSGEGGRMDMERQYDVTPYSGTHTNTNSLSSRSSSHSNARTWEPFVHVLRFNSSAFSRSNHFTNAFLPSPYIPFCLSTHIIALSHPIPHRSTHPLSLSLPLSLPLLAGIPRQMVWLGRWSDWADGLPPALPMKTNKHWLQSKQNLLQGRGPIRESLPQLMSALTEVSSQQRAWRSRRLTTRGQVTPI